MIITQKFKNEAQKLFNEVLKRELMMSHYEFFPCFTDSFSSIKILENLKTFSINVLKKAISLIDEAFLNSDYRKKHFYKSATHSRTIIKVFGELEFERNYYVDKNKKNGFYLIDLLFNFEEYKTYDPVVRGIIINNSIISNPNSVSNNYDLHLLNFADYLNKYNSINKIPRQTIYNWIKEWDLPKVEYDYLGNDKILYVMVDEKWIHEQIRLATLDEEEKKKRHYIMSKCFVTFTGAKRKKQRTELLNRHIFITSSKNPWKEFINEIYNIYNFEELEEIYLLSDSGSWILAGKNELKLFKNNKVILNTCEFHVKEYINRMVRDKEKRRVLIKTIYEDRNKKAFIKIADEIIKETKNKDKKTQYKNYILNHWKAILNMKDREIKSSMESHISHYVASTFGSRPKGYSKKRIQKYLKLQEYQINGINILDLYLNSYNKKEENNFIYNKDNLSFSIFEKTSSFPHKSSSNPISILLNNIAYGC